MRLKDKVALVTGSGSGFGAAMDAAGMTGRRREHFPPTTQSSRAHFPPSSPTSRGTFPLHFKRLSNAA